MKCHEARQEIKAYIDGELDSITRWRVAWHLNCCPSCRMEEIAMTDLTNDFGNIHGAPAPEGLRGKVLSSLDFKPAPSARKRLTSHVAFQFAVLGLIVIALAAILFPVFSRARCSSEAARTLYRQRQAAVRAETAASVPAKTGEAFPPPAAQRVSKTSDYDIRVVPKIRQGAANATLDVSKYREFAQSGTPAQAPASDSPVFQMIIKSADVRVQVKRFEEAYDKAVYLAGAFGGYVTDSSTQTEGSDPSSGSLTIKVPVRAFERALNSLGTLGKLESKQISGEDVTGEAVDIQSRLRNKRAEERQYLEIMNRAKRISDIMVVSNELYRVRGEIEEMQGRLSYLEKSSAMSTINLTLSEKAKRHAAAAGPTLGRTLGDAWRSLADTTGGLARAAIWLVVFSPFWALPIVAFVLVRKRMVVAGNPTDA